MTFDPTNRGTLSRNERKTEDKHPDFAGDISPKCPHCGQTFSAWLSGWVKERKDGSGRFFSLSMRPKEDKKPAAPKPAPTIADMTDDVPF